MENIPNIAYSDNIFFNSHHSPMGAFASFTLGYAGAKGGLGAELSKPADQNVFIGLETVEGGHYQALPFFEVQPDEAERYTGAGENTAEPTGENHTNNLVAAFPASAVRRDFRLTTDTWQAQDLTFRILSPVFAIPDPSEASEHELKLALVPAVLAELTIDNRECSHQRRAFVGYQGNDPYSTMRQMDDTSGGKFTGIAEGRHSAIASNSPLVTSASSFDMSRMLSCTEPENLKFGLGDCCALLIEVPAGQQITVRFAACFYRAGIVTTGVEAAYYYTHCFENIEGVADFALTHWDELANRSRAAEAEWESATHLSADQKFSLAQAVHSYYGSSELLIDRQGQPLWIVNEGEYRMINTLDLTVDQLFYELKFNPWTVRNTLDQYLVRYSYTDMVHLPGDSQLYPGGLSFTHDMGRTNVFSRPHYSSYEMTGLDDCFSYMTQEQLVNWILCAALYIQQAQDRGWLQTHQATLAACFESMVNRDHPDPARRDGIMDADSSRTGLTGAEITTYDSLDTSLGQSRRNTYLAGKCWAAYVLLAHLFEQLGQTELAKEATAQAQRNAATQVGQLNAQGFIPALLDGNSQAKIIPIIEGLIFPYLGGCAESVTVDGPFGEYVQALQTHLNTVLGDSSCLFADGGWQLSATSSNSWLSKIYLCQFIARQILTLPWDEAGQQSDKVHAKWLLDPYNTYYAWSDQMLAGKVMGSKYYPRGVTSILWLSETNLPQTQKD